MSTLLALETATAACSAALWLDGEIKSRFEIAPQRHSGMILDMVDELLCEAGIKLSRLDAVAFGSGPGSFMGVRLATGVAQGIAFGVGCPVIPVSTLQALAQSAYQKIRSKQVLAGWDARMQAIYWGKYQVDSDGVMQSVTPDQLSDPADIEWPGENWVAVGNAWMIYQADLKEVRRGETDIYPDAASVAIIGNKKLAHGDTRPPDESEPTYLRQEVAKKPKKC